MPFTIAYKKKYKVEKSLASGESFSALIKERLDTRYRYKIRIRGGVNIPYADRTEDRYPLYFRKIDDSLIWHQDGYTLEFNSRNQAYERSCYTMIRDEFKEGDYTLSFLSKAQGINNNVTVQAEVYYGESHSRYYYEKPDAIYQINVENSDTYKRYQTQIPILKNVDFIMLKISGLGFEGEASFYSPIFEKDKKNYAPSFEYAPEILRGQAWIGEGFSWTERPYFEVFVNGKKIFAGVRSDCLQCLRGVEFCIPEGILNDSDNTVELLYGKDNKIDYCFNEIQLLRLPKETEILGLSEYQTVNKAFGALCYIPQDEKIEVEVGEELRYLGLKRIDGEISVLKFIPTKCGVNVKIKVKSGENIRERCVEITEEKKDFIITGSGDFIYIPQKEEDFYEYLAWYLNSNIGDLLTFRSCYRWGGTAEYDANFWRKAVALLKEFGIYYALMIDGRELNGVNANPPLEILKSEYFLGEQTHERDGAFTYWVQDADEYEAFFYHLLSRKLQRNGIYGKYSPVYNKQGQARIYYAEDKLKNVKDAYEHLLDNLTKTAADGATRHTGVTPMFDIFFKAGYKWQGLESMYGSHEIMLGALRGMSNSIGKNDYGTHLALQWANVPCDNAKHALRYRLSLYLSYMHGVSQINTEEGLWNIENPFEGFDRFSYACRLHVKEQERFNAFVKRHNRTGKQVRRIAMMVGKYDGMDCFSTGSVYGQKGEFWRYNTPEQSWDLLKVFYPQAKLGSIYHFIKKGGKKGLRKKDKEYLDAWGYMFGEKEKYDCVRDYESLGYFSSTPYGVIDLIASDAKNLSDYEFIFLLGWNTCTKEQLMALCDYMEQGGKVMLAKSHLYENVDREEVFTGNSRVLQCEWKEKLLSYQDTGALIFFDENEYPIVYKQAYADRLKQEGERYSCKYVKDLDNISFTEYLQDNGSTTLYLLNIDWWDKTPAKATLVLGAWEYLIQIKDNIVKMMCILPGEETAVLCEDERVDIRAVSKNTFIISGFGEVKLSIYHEGKKRTLKIKVDGEATVHI